MMINKAAAAFALADLPADLDAEAVQRCIEAIVALCDLRYANGETKPAEKR